MLRIYRFNKKDLLLHYSQYESMIREDFPKFSFKKLRDDIQYEYFIILLEENFLGFFIIFNKQRFQTFFLNPFYRRLGVGSELLKELKIRYPDAYFFVKKSNTNAVNFFKKSGFVVKKELEKGKILKMGLYDNMERIDKFFVINLASEKERRKNMEMQFSNLGIKNYEFVEAVDKEHINLEQLKEYKKWAYPNNNFYCDKNCSCKGLGHILTEGQIACFLSHYNVWKLIIERGYKTCIVLEDDFIFNDEINMDEILQNFPDKWDYLYLGHSHYMTRYKKRNYERVNEYFYKIEEGFGQTHIYAITEDCAKKLKKMAFPLRAAVDGFISYFFIKKGGGDAYISNKDIGYNGSVQKIFTTSIT